MTCPRAERIERSCRENTTAHREFCAPAPCRTSVPPLTSFGWIRHFLSVVNEQQACYMLTRFSRTTDCLRAGLLGVQRRTRVVSDRRRPPLHGRSAPCTSVQARPDVFSNLREHKALRVLVCRHASTRDLHGMWHNICVYTRSETWTTRVQTATD
jgi:hypothetical protein